MRKSRWRSLRRPYWISDKKLSGFRILVQRPSNTPKIIKIGQPCLWTCLHGFLVDTLLKQRQMRTVSRHSFSRYRSQPAIIKHFPFTLIQLYQLLCFEVVIIFINMSCVFDASIIYTSMYMVSENCHHVLAKYKVGFSPLNLNNRESDWLMGKSRMKQVARIEQCSIVKTVARDF